MRDFELDPGTVKVDWALDGPVPWADRAGVRARARCTSPTPSSEMTEALGQVPSGAVPAAPFLLDRADDHQPTRPARPAGTESFWAYTHVPQRETRATPATEVRGAWDHDDCERFADRMQARIERLAPGLRRPRRSRAGSSVPASSRPATPTSSAAPSTAARRSCTRSWSSVRCPACAAAPTTGVRGLYLGSASAHPGGGVHGAAGANAARAALLHAPAAPRCEPGVRRAMTERSSTFGALTIAFDDRVLRPAAVDRRPVASGPPT